MSLTYGLDADGPAVILTDEALAAMLRHRQQRARDPEAGGQLFARFEGDSTVIIEATGPKCRDRRSRYLFIPDRLLQRQEILARHRDGKHFVGDWHTHPEPVPSPSRALDIAGMIDCFQKSRHDLQAFVMVIVGTAEPPEGIYVGLVDGNGVRQLSVLAAE